MGPPESRSEAETFWGDPASHDEKNCYASPDKGRYGVDEVFTE